MSYIRMSIAKKVLIVSMFSKKRRKYQYLWEESAVNNEQRQ